MAPTFCQCDDAKTRKGTSIQTCGPDSLIETCSMALGGYLNNERFVVYIYIYIYIYIYNKYIVVLLLQQLLAYYLLREYIYIYIYIYT